MLLKAPVAFALRIRSLRTSAEDGQLVLPVDILSTLVFALRGTLVLAQHTSWGWQLQPAVGSVGSSSGSRDSSDSRGRVMWYARQVAQQGGTTALLQRG